MKNNKANLIIADDHLVFAEGITALLQEKELGMNISVVGNATDLQKEFQNRPIDIAIVDIEFGTADGREVTLKLKKEYPDCAFIALSSHTESAIIKSALNGAYVAYILKTDSLDTIVECINKVQSGAKFISPNTGTALLDDISGSSKKQLMPKLTKREAEVLDCIAKEMSSKEIAAYLYLSEKTVEVHRSNLFLKLDVKNVAGLIRRAFEVGLLS